ncbi:MAG: hypothetical protein JRL30_02055 [Deltaproteobacteria bacterium]|nr:hypothetical protein [Deltaproteobacteria bacterium]
MGDKSARKQSEKVALIKTLGEIFNDPSYLYPIILFFLLLSGLTAYVFKVEKISANQFLFMAFGLAIIFLLGPLISRLVNLRTQNSNENVMPFIQKGKQDHLTYSQIQLVGRDHPQIWENFTHIYNAFNAPWVLETQGDTIRYVKIHRSRYKNPKLIKCRYLYFYEDDERNWNTFAANFDRFIRFEAMVFLDFSAEAVYADSFLRELETKIESGSIEKMAKKNELYLVKREIPQMTFFQGTKNGTQTAILYFSVGPFMVRGLPSKVLYSENSEFAARLGDYFNDEILKPSTERYAGIDIFRFFLDQQNRLSPI